MNLKLNLSALLLVITFIACNETVKEKKIIPFDKDDYYIQVISEKQIPLSSGSGITGFNHGFLIVGDDTPWMYYMDSTGVITDSLRLSYQEGYYPGVRMDGMIKPDFESITRLNKNIVLVMSSGSSNPARDTSYLVNAEDKVILTKRSMGELFEAMADSAGFNDRHLLNIEGSNVAQSDLYLFNRGDFSGKNFVFKMDVTDYISWFSGYTDTLPEFETQRVKLPSFKESEMTFSSAYYAKKFKIFAFTATSEIGGFLGLDGIVTDGVAAGTSFGFINPDAFDQDIEIPVQPIIRDGKILPIKIEGFWPLKQVDDRTVLFYAVSDPDDGTTVLYSLQIQFKDSI
jgi:hypothetical protein